MRTNAQVRPTQTRENDAFDQKLAMTSRTIPTPEAPMTRRNSSGADRCCGAYRSKV